MSIVIEKRAHPTWRDGVVITDGRTELVVTADVGPNIIHCSLAGKPNMMRLFGRDVPTHANTQWQGFGGHRLWHAPEAWESTYVSDSFPPVMTFNESGVDAEQAKEEITGLQKRVSVSLQADGSIKVRHAWLNLGVWPIRIAAWAITVLDTGGLLWVPQPRSEFALLPNRTVTLWPYSRMNDPRVTWGAHSVLLRQDPKAAAPFKFGMSQDEGVSAYFNHGQMFVKQAELIPGAEYPDMGCSFESYTNGDILEMETLSPMVTVGPGETVEHTEIWRLFECAEIPANENEAESLVREVLENA